MAIELIEKEVQRFLASDKPEALCITGRWGVGKTFAWNRFLNQSKSKSKIALKRYSYISLFGINSLDELKYAIFENSIHCSEIGMEPSLDTLRTNASVAAEHLGRTSLWFLQQLPFIKNHIGGLGPVWFLSVRNTIVCIDDIERCGTNLQVRDVLGLISNLKEHKNCKVCLILNDEAFDTERDAEFRRYLEKVVDVSVKFDPSPAESVRIALVPEDETIEMLSQSCISLGISNIRVIKRIERLVNIVSPALKQFNKQVLQQAVQSLALLGWIVFEPDRAPSLEYLLNRRSADVFGADDEKPVPENEAAWNALLDAYGFFFVDEFDKALLDGIRNGFFDESSIEKHAQELDSVAKKAQLESSFHNAWELYHASFDNNEEEVINAIYQSFIEDVQNISPLNLGNTVMLFKELGKNDLATEILRIYVERRGSERELFNLRSLHLFGEVKDKDVAKAFADKYASYGRDVKSPETILLRMAEINGWSPDDIKTLASLPVAEYYDLFKRVRGRDLHKIMAACLQFESIGNASDDMQRILMLAKSALRRIGTESPINALRVKRYGVDVSRPEASESAS